MKEYTKIPNSILDNMSDLKPAAFKLAMALCRLTYGFHRSEVTASLSDLQTMTGLSRQGIINASKEIEHLFTSQLSGKTNVWLVNSVDHTSQLSVPVQSTKLTDDSQLSVPSTSSPKESIKENIKETIKENEDTSLGAVFTLYHNNIGGLNKIMSDDIESAYDDYGGQWMIDAITEAVRNGVCKWNYIHAILKNWKQNGRQSSRKNGNQSTITKDETGGVYV